MTPTTLDIRVSERKDEAEGIAVFDLVAADGSELPAFDAGAHIDVYVPNGLIRQYSLCNAPSERERYQIAVLRDPASRGGSRALHDAVASGTTLTIGVPRNLFKLEPTATRSVLLGGGIGVTPLMSMAEQLHAEGARFDFHYCTRSPAHTAFRQRIDKAPWKDRVQMHFSSERRLDIGDALAHADEHTHLYVCGPERFIEAVRDTAFALGWPDENVHFEFFAAAGSAPDASDEPFEMEISSTGQVLEVPVDKTALEVLIDNGFNVTSSCEQGVCGACLTAVLDGEPDHRDQYLTDDERGLNRDFLPCCSRSKSKRLVVDL